MSVREPKDKLNPGDSVDYWRGEVERIQGDLDRSRREVEGLEDDEAEALRRLGQARAHLDEVLRPYLGPSQTITGGSEP